MIFRVAGCVGPPDASHVHVIGYGTDVDLASVEADIEERDRRDSTRTDSPLVKADDAIELDTTDLSIEEQVERVLELAVERGAKVRPANDEAGGE